MKTLNERLVLDTTGKMKDMKQQPQQQPADDDHTPNVFDQYLLKYGGTRVLDEYFAIQRVDDNMYEMGTVGIEKSQHHCRRYKIRRHHGTMSTGYDKRTELSNDLRMYKV